MARPKVPLISREIVLDQALSIIDGEGIDALSIRRLATELNVNGASLYHHFTNKEAILVGAAELAVARTPIGVRTRRDVDWREWLLDGARQLRDVLLAHPGLVPIIVRRRTLGVQADALEGIAAKLLARGVRASSILTLFEALEHFVIGTAVRQASGDAAVSEQEAADGRTFPSLQFATLNRDGSVEDYFDVIALGIMNSICGADSPLASGGAAGAAT